MSNDFNWPKKGDKAFVSAQDGAYFHVPSIRSFFPSHATSFKEWSVIVWDDAASQAVAHAGIVIRQARWNDCAVNAGGIGGVMTHPDFRGRGYARTAVNRAVEFFREQGDVDFALLVCKSSLIPLYERFGWTTFSGVCLSSNMGSRSNSRSMYR